MVARPGLVAFSYYVSILLLPSMMQHVMVNKKKKEKVCGRLILHRNIFRTALRLTSKTLLKPRYFFLGK